MITIEKGEYECPKCKKMSVISRTKKSEIPLLCCDTQMVIKEKTKFTEHPEPKAKSSATKTKTKTKRKRSVATTTVKAVEEAPEFPLIPGDYRCPTCGLSRELKLTDNRDKPMRCTTCFVKMVRI